MVEERGCSNTEILPEPQHSPGLLPAIKLACSPLPASVCFLGAGGVRTQSALRHADSILQESMRVWPHCCSDALAQLGVGPLETPRDTGWKVKVEMVRKTMLLEGKDMETDVYTLMIAY